MANTEFKTIVALFDNMNQAQDAVRSLEAEGFSRNEISILGKSDLAGSETGFNRGETRSETGSSAAAGAGTGAVVGAGVGGAVGLVASLASLSIPVIGPVLAAGPLWAALAGAGVGAAAGGLIGALTGAGVPEHEAEYYTEGVRRGGALVTVRAVEDRAERAADLLDDMGAVDVDKRAADWTASGWTPPLSEARTGTGGTGMSRGAMGAPGATEGSDIAGTSTTSRSRRVRLYGPLEEEIETEPNEKVGSRRSTDMGRDIPIGARKTRQP